MPCYDKYISYLRFFGDLVVKNPPANAGDTGSIPGLGRPHMPQSNWACAPQQEKSPKREACTLQLESSPCSPQLEKNPCSNKDLAQPNK